MTKLGNAPLHWRLRRNGIGIGLVAALAFAGAVFADAPPAPRDPPAAVVGSGSTVAPEPAAPAAAPVLTADPRPALSPPSSEQQQRRVLILLLMNSAGPLGPYGSLGR